MFYKYEDLSISDLRSLADSGDAAALFSLSSRLSEGAGIKCDQEKADEYDLQSAMAGYAPAQFALAISEDITEAEQKRWYQKATSLGWPERAVNSGDPLARFQYGELLMSELHGVELDFNKVFQLSCNSTDWRLISMAATAALAMDDMSSFEQELVRLIKYEEVDNAFFYYLKAELLLICQKDEVGEYYMLKAAEKGYEDAVEKLFERESSLN